MKKYENYEKPLRKMCFTDPVLFLENPNMYYPYAPQGFIKDNIGHSYRQKVLMLYLSTINDKDKALFIYNSTGYDSELKDFLKSFLEQQKIEYKCKLLKQAANICIKSSSKTMAQDLQYFVGLGLFISKGFIKKYKDIENEQLGIFLSKTMLDKNLSVNSKNVLNNNNVLPINRKKIIKL